MLSSLMPTTRAVHPSARNLHYDTRHKPKENVCVTSSADSATTGSNAPSRIIMIMSRMSKLEREDNDNKIT
jgi:hypothetical protein